MGDYPQMIVPIDHVEPVPRRVRATLGGQVVLDTTRALYLWEVPYYPQFYIPMDDVNRDFLIDEQHSQRLHRGQSQLYSLVYGDIVRPGAVRVYIESSFEGLS